MDHLGTDVTKVAAAYAAFAGLLAGFVFAVMGYLLGSRRSREGEGTSQELDATLSWSVLAFVSLSLASFLFALLSGEDRFNPSASSAILQPTRIRPLVLSIIASGVLTTAILALLLALIWLFKLESTSSIVRAQLRLVIYLTGLLTLYYLDGTFTAVPVAQGSLPPDDTSSLIPLCEFFVGAVALGELLGIILRRTGRVPRQVVRVVAQTLFLLVVFASGGFFNLVDYANEAGSSTWHITTYEWWGVGGLAAVLFLCILNLPGWCASDTQEQLSPTPSHRQA